ncbi:hypothetical protein AAKU55_004647 [Oxalobacteraceae bacterium GrIS 1.11]
MGDGFAKVMLECKLSYINNVKLSITSVAKLAYGAAPRMTGAAGSPTLEEWAAMIGAVLRDGSGSRREPHASRVVRSLMATPMTLTRPPNGRAAA